MMAEPKRGAPLIHMRTNATDTATAEFCTCALTGAQVPNPNRRRPLVM